MDLDKSEHPLSLMESEDGVSAGVLLAVGSIPLLGSEKAFGFLPSHMVAGYFKAYSFTKRTG